MPKSGNGSRRIDEINDRADITKTPTNEGPTHHAALSPFWLSGSPRLIKSPPGLDIGGVDSEINIKSGKSWRQDQAKNEQAMIQSLDKNPTRICIDSGAGESVCPVDFFPDYEMHETEKVGNLYRAAGPGAQEHGRKEA